MDFVGAKKGLKPFVSPVLAAVFLREWGLSFFNISPQVLD
jgi:hypothetical protein